MDIQVRRTDAPEVSPEQHLTVGLGDAIGGWHLCVVTGPMTGAGAAGWKPDRAALSAAYGRTIPDLIGPGLSVVFCGINPGLWSAAVGHHFGRPGNRFWPALYGGGLTPRQLRPDEQDELLGYGYGVTNLVRRATARADELTPAEFVAGGRALVAKVRRYRPAWLAVLGTGAYRIAFGDRTAVVGPQSRSIAATRVWVLPNPSGLNAHYQLADLAAEFARLRETALDSGRD
jgi:TDG/mug DNA glycosylase family protein